MEGISVEKGNTSKIFLKVMEIFFDSLVFISIQYVLLCCMYSFRTHIVYVFFFALNISLICKHFANLKKEISNRPLFVIVAALNIIFLAGFMLEFGYPAQQQRLSPHALPRL